MKKKIIGIFVCMLLIATTLSATGTMNVHTSRYVNDNNYCQPYQNNPANSPGLISIKINAKVYVVDDSHNLLGGLIHVNDTITGTYTYDSGIPDSSPDDTTIGSYRFTSSSCGIDLKANGLVFKTNPSNVDFIMGIYDNYLQSNDIYYLHSFNNLQLSNGMLVTGIYWNLMDSSKTAISSDALPTSAPILTDFDYNVFNIYGKDPSNPNNTYEIYAHVTKVTKSKARDEYYTGQPVLIWLLERFPNMLPIIRNLIKL